MQILRIAGCLGMTALLFAFVALNPLFCTCPFMTEHHVEHKHDGHCDGKHENNKNNENNSDHSHPDLHSMPAAIVTAAAQSEIDEKAADSAVEQIFIHHTQCCVCPQHRKSQRQSKAPPPEHILENSYGLKAPPLS